ncbi:MAG: class I SAM-dependent methyltransferase [Tepidisphaeraceae bacterium]|jgi:ubiquinone/menaquinone biosynthesis C-methylase UbiE
MKRRPPAAGASQRYHNRLARQYDAVYDDAYWRWHDRLTWDAIKPYLPHNAAASCCDLGCGTGKWGLKLLKSGFATTFVDHSPAMIEQTRQKLHALGAKAKRATLLVADIVDLSLLACDPFDLILAMGDPLSICADTSAAVAEMRRICKAGGIVIATADNKLAAAEYFLQRGDLDGLESFLRTGRTHWLTRDRQEQFELTTFTPGELVRLFERGGFQVLRLTGKTILPIRAYKQLLDQEGAFARLLRLESELAKDTTSAARASHLQIIAKKI